nr:hypothetical protein [Piscirickettsia salmonis]
MGVNSLLGVALHMTEGAFVIVTFKPKKNEESLLLQKMTFF